MFRKLLLFFGMCLVLNLSACEDEKVSIEFEDINDAGIARFEIENNTEKNIRSFTTELTYLSEDDRALRIDTVDYSVRDKTRPFVKAGEETFIVQKVPEGTVSARGRILNFQVME